MGKIWLFASGKGGVGKSTVTAALGTALSRKGFRVCILDGDIGLRDQDVLLGMQDRVIYDLLDVLNGTCTLEQALLRDEKNGKLCLLPAAQIARSRDLDRKAFRSLLTEIRDLADFILLDAPAGIEKGLRNLLTPSIDETVILCTPDDVCIRNAERVISLLDDQRLPRPRLIVNRLDPELIRHQEMYDAAVTAQTLDLALLGEIPEDRDLYRAQLAHCSPQDVDCPASAAIVRIGDRMTGADIPLPGIGTDRVPWYRRLFMPEYKEVRRLDH